MILNTIIGIDEAGRGPLIGRVYAGAVIIDKDIDKDINNIITDSKKMSKKKRNIAYNYIINNLKFGVGYADEKEIDDINILQATRKAMERAINNIREKYNIKEYKLMIDGCYWEKYFENCESIVKGDLKIKEISAASIIAKEYHDMHIIELCKDNPELNKKYDLLNNMGYGTKKHIQGLELYGTSKYHRLSFKRCKN
jgi:ribonuclease HII